MCSTEGSSTTILASFFLFCWSGKKPLIDICVFCHCREAAVHDPKAGLSLLFLQWDCRPPKGLLHSPRIPVSTSQKLKPPCLLWHSEQTCKQVCFQNVDVSLLMHTYLWRCACVHVCGCIAPPVEVVLFVSLYLYLPIFCNPLLHDPLTQITHIQRWVHAQLRNYMNLEEVNPGTRT